MNVSVQNSRDNDHGEELFAWAVIAPVLIKHYSIVSPADRDMTVCACSPAKRRTVEQWARHVSDEIARSLA
ncbi:hypothetical protein BVC93_04465 [Mycobacterium sp. MS1601]|nr:hypothetical protein BVC93_04465 [Mycobacterium sp. MS1601]